MSDFGEALGTVTEGGLYARILARETRPEAPAAKGHFAESACLNCGTPLIGSHCHECGQAAHLHRTLGALWHDIAHGVFHFEGKTWRTLPMLAFKPGELTRRYIGGERAKFVSPMALFLFSVFLMFAVFQAVGLTGSGEIIDPTASARKTAVETKREFARRLNALDDNDSAGRAELGAKIAKVEAALKAMDAGDDFSFENAAGGRTFQEINITGVDFIDKRIVKKWRHDPGLMLYKLQSNSYKFSWLLIPLSLPFMWLLFAWKRGVKLYDHAIFVTYSIAFMSLLFIVLSVLGAIGAPDWLIVTGATAVPAMHIARQLKGAYGLSRRSAAWRLFAMLFVVLTVLIMFLTVLMLLGAL